MLGNKFVHLWRHHLMLNIGKSINASLARADLSKYKLIASGLVQSEYVTGGSANEDARRRISSYQWDSSYLPAQRILRRLKIDYVCLNAITSKRSSCAAFALHFSVQVSILGLARYLLLKVARWMCFLKGENLQVKVVLRYIIRKYKFDIGRYDSGTRRQQI